MSNAANHIGKLTLSNFWLKTSPNVCCCKLHRPVHELQLKLQHAVRNWELFDRLHIVQTLVEIAIKCELLQAALANFR